MSEPEAGPSTSGSAPGSSGTNSAADRREERMKKFRELHLKRNEGTKLNHKEVVEEHRRATLPANWEKKREWLEYKLNEEELREKCREQGIDYERQKLLETQADDAEKRERKKASKKNPDKGFSSFDAATARKYDQLSKQLKPNMDEYQQAREEMGDEAFYASANTMVAGKRKDNPEAVDQMVEDLNKQIEKRAKFSRRRTFDSDADIDYINDRNMRFNKKLERFYGNYTQEIKQNLERGTAI